MFLFGLDTIHLHRGTRSNLTALPNQKIHVGVANDSWDLIELFAWLFLWRRQFSKWPQRSGVSEADYEESKIRNEWRSLSAEAFVTKKTKINFRDPNLELID